MMNVTSTSPIWLYCSQGKHCEAGMSMVINQAASGPNTIQAYQMASMNATTAQPAVIQGGVVMDNSGTSTSSTAAASGTAASTASTTSSAAVQSSTSSGASDTKKFGWAGFSVASVAALVFGGLLV